MEKKIMLTPYEAAKFLDISYATLLRLRKAGKGPPYVLIGKRAKYRQEQLEEWLEQGGESHESGNQVRKSNPD